MAELTQSRTYLDDGTIKSHPQEFLKSPKSTVRSDKIILLLILRAFFTEHERFEVVKEELRGGPTSVTGITILKYSAPPRERIKAYQYCLVESKKIGTSWNKTQDRLSTHCGNTANASRQLYGIIQIGLHLQFFTADKGALTPLSGRINLRDDVDDVTTMLEYMKHHSFPFA